MGAERGRQLTADNTNARGHRVVGDTLVFECEGCEFGEIPLTDLIEAPQANCPDCGAAYAVHLRRVDD